MALKKDGTWDNRFRFDHVHKNDDKDIAAIKKIAKRKATYEKRYGISYAERELRKMMRSNRRVGWIERKEVGKKFRVIPGHRQYVIDKYGFFYRRTGRTVADLDVPMNYSVKWRPKKDAPGGKHKVFYIQVRYKDIEAMNPDTGEVEVVGDKLGVWKYLPHVLVMDLFGPDRPDDGRGYYIDFKNGNRFDFRLANLYWAPVSQRFAKWRDKIAPEDYWRRGQKLSEQSKQRMRKPKGKRKTIKQQ